VTRSWRRRSVPRRQHQTRGEELRAKEPFSYEHSMLTIVRLAANARRPTTRKSVERLQSNDAGSNALNQCPLVELASDPMLVVTLGPLQRLSVFGSKVSPIRNSASPSSASTAFLSTARAPTRSRATIRHLPSTRSFFHGDSGREAATGCRAGVVGSDGDTAEDSSLASLEWATFQSQFAAVLSYHCRA
jgi:hypothetical protein